MSESYKPIACALHDEYEVAIMHKTPLQLKWEDDDGYVYNETVLPVDIEVSNGEEFLIVKEGQGDEVKKIRLDRISTKSSFSV